MMSSRRNNGVGQEIRGSADQRGRVGPGQKKLAVTTNVLTAYLVRYRGRRAGMPAIHSGPRSKVDDLTLLAAKSLSLDMVTSEEVGIAVCRLLCVAAAGSSSARAIVTASAVTMVRVKVHILVILVLLFGAR